MQDLKNLPQDFTAAPNVKLGKAQRPLVEDAMRERVQQVCDQLERLTQSPSGYRVFGKELFALLHGEGIENIEDLRDFINTTGKDGEILEDICADLNTDVTQVRKAVRDLKKQTGHQQQEVEMETDEGIDTNTCGNTIQDYEQRF
ncbi:hypothetical protein Y032_0085g1860 [Ancylostoma ceylanicum]|uniref:Uncharacterized protein n=1 Tax=Ancylostoma ceylanicum TaxID=53326 RepID=A0A016TR65_9BILA|nr:hypothetical protein Y032_0085g1860 [Ancylostoma ceylanicum]